MATEIERKFLVTGSQWRSAAAGERIRQGYLWADQARSLRVRIAGARAFLTLKSARTGFTRQEYEYEIPLWNYWAAVQPLPDQGLSDDRFHLTFARNFFDDPKRMENAWPWRNLTALQSLDAVHNALKEK